MGRFIEGEDRQQVSLMPECLDDYIAQDNSVRVIDAFVGELELTELASEGAAPAATGRVRFVRYSQAAAHAPRAGYAREGARAVRHRPGNAHWSGR